MLHAQLVALVLAAGTLAASGCGESSKTTSPANTPATTTTATTAAQATTSTQTTPAVATGQAIKVQAGKPLSRTSWISKGDAICTNANLKRHASAARTHQDLVRMLPQAATYDRVEATELSKLVPPTTMASDWQQIVTGFQKLGEYTSKTAQYVDANEVPAASPTIIAGNTVQLHLTAIAKRDGFKKCSQQ